MDKFYIEIAGLVAQINCAFPFVRRHCHDYIVDDSEICDVVAETNENEMAHEAQTSGRSFSDGYLEDVCLYRSIAEQIPEFDAFVFHGAAVSIDGEGYVFTAPSGTGKTTHIDLLLKHYPERVKIINGDKPIIRILEDGVYVCSTPWAGKENWQVNTRAKLRGIVLLSRAADNHIERVEPARHFGEIIHQVYLPRESSAKEKTLELINALAARVNFYSLGCNISPDAAKTSFDELSQKE